MNLICYLVVINLFLALSSAQATQAQESCVFRNVFVDSIYNITMFRGRCTCPSRAHHINRPIHPSLSNCAVKCIKHLQRWGSPCELDNQSSAVSNAVTSCCNQCGGGIRRMGITSYSKGRKPFEFSATGCAPLPPSPVNICRLVVRQNAIRFRLPIVTRQCRCSRSGPKSWAMFPADRAVFPCVSSCMQGQNGDTCDDGDASLSRHAFRKCCESTCGGSVIRTALFTGTGTERRKIFRMGCRKPQQIQTSSPSPSPSMLPDDCQLGLTTRDENTGAPIVITECQCKNGLVSGTALGVAKEVLPCMTSCMGGRNNGRRCIFGQHLDASGDAYTDCCFNECDGEIGTADVGEDIDPTTLYTNARFRQACVPKADVTPPAES